VGRVHDRPALTLLRALRSVSVFAAIFAFVSLVGSSLHVVPTLEGVWRGVLDPPGMSRLVVAAGLAVAATLLEHRRPALGGPLLCLGLAAAPLVPVATGQLLPLLFFQGLGLLLVALPAAAVALVSLSPPRRPWPTGLAGLFAALVFLVLATRLPGPAGAQGDEPHYLTMAESLWSDGDLDLRDEFRRREYRSFYRGDLDAHTSPASPRGKLYAIHAPGLAFVILPGYVLGGEAGVRILLALLSAVTAALVFALVREANGDENAARVSFAALVLGAPLAFYANQIYPEVAAALVSACFLHTSRRDGGVARVLVAGFGAGALVWLHPKFLPLALVGLLLTLARRGPVPWRAAGALLFATGLVTLQLWMNSTYGTPSLTAAYGRRVADDVQSAFAARGLPGLFFDREFGLLLHAPAWALCALGLGPLWRRRPGDLTRALLLAASVVLVGAAYSMWWGGSCPPGRFLVPALPSFALLLAPAWRRAPRLLAALLGFGAGVVSIAILQPRALHNRADGDSALLRVVAPTVHLERALPSFVGAKPAWGPATAADIDRRSAALRALLHWDGGNVRSAAGRLDPRALAIPLLDTPWPLGRDETRSTPRIGLPPGDYEVRVRGESRATGRLVRLVVTLDGDDLARAFFGSEERAPVIVLELARGARKLEVWATGIRPGATLTALEVVPRRVAPRGQRGAWTDTGEPDPARLPEQGD